MQRTAATLIQRWMLALALIVLGECRLPPLSEHSPCSSDNPPLYYREIKALVSIQARKCIRGAAAGQSAPLLFRSSRQFSTTGLGNITHPVETLHGTRPTYCGDREKRHVLELLGGEAFC